MKKLNVFFLLLSLTLLLMTLSVEASIRVVWDERNVTFVDGVRHTQIIGKMTFNDIETRQVFNYFGGNPKARDDLHLVVGDHYSQYEWGMGNLNTIIQDVNERYQNYEVIGGVNADFYNMMTGHPVEGYVRNYEVLTQGLTSRTLVGFKDDGTVIFGKPCFEGFHLIVYNEDGARKHEIEISAFNRLPSSDQITVYFPDFAQTISGGLNKAVIDASEIKMDGYNVRYFGKGILSELTNEEIQVPEHSFIIVGQSFNDDNLITETDQVVIQQKLGCGYEDVRFAVGAWEHLVKDGVPTLEFSEGASTIFRNPRTAIGVEADGTVFFVTVDGRNKPAGMEGVTAVEMAQIMAYFGAVEAYNLDGGGSTTLSIKDENSNYQVINTPSDGSIRRISNAILFVKGHHIPRLPDVPFPDYRIQLETPGQAYIDREGFLKFDPVENATHYQVLINDMRISTDNHELSLADLDEGRYEIRVRAQDQSAFYRHSEFSETIIYYAYPNDINHFIELMRNFAKNRLENED
jgi:hypothetical protein